MSQARTIKAIVKGSIKGQVAVGDHILQLGNVNWGNVSIVLSSKQLSFKRLGRAINLRPRRDKFFLDREPEIKTIKDALKSSRSVLVVGQVESESRPYCMKLLIFQRQGNFGMALCC